LSHIASQAGRSPSTIYRTNGRCQDDASPGRPDSRDAASNTEKARRARITFLMLDLRLTLKSTRVRDARSVEERCQAVSGLRRSAKDAREHAAE